MAIRSLNRLGGLRRLLVRARRIWLLHVRGVEIDPTATCSLSSRMIAAGRGDISIGAESLVAFKTLLLSIDIRTGAVRPVRVGRRCFIGGGSMILPGVTIGDESIVAAGAVVFEDVPPRSIVGGNPARVLRRDIVVGRFGRMEGASDNTGRMWKA